MRLCAPHFGQTCQLASRSFFQMIWRQPSHFCQRPSVRTLRSASPTRGSLSSSLLSRLNQDIEFTTLARVRMSPQGCKRTINLLGEHGAGEFVRKRHGREGEEQVGAGAPERRETIVATDGEDEVAA